MSLFFINQPSVDGVAVEKTVVIHKTQPLMAAVYQRPNAVVITDYEGEVLTVVKEPAGGLSTVNANANASALVWHPTEKVLMIGWSSGKMTMWSMPAAGELGLEDRVPAGISGTTSAMQSLSAKAAIAVDVEGAVREHNAGAVVCMEWTAQGQYMLSASAQKAAVLWALERSTVTTDKSSASAGVSMKLKPLWSVEPSAPIVRAIAVPAAPADAVPRTQLSGDASGAEANAKTAAAAKVGGSTDKGGADDETVFLLVDGSNKLQYVNEEQRLATCVTADERISSVLYDPGERTLAVLTQANHVEVFKLSDEMKVTSQLRRKLPLGGITLTEENLTVKMVWAAPGLIAFACGDDSIRMLDIASESLYSVPFPAHGSHVSAVAADVHKCIMVAGTLEGSVVLFEATTPVGTAATSAASKTAAQRHRSNGTTSLLSKQDPGKRWEAFVTHDLGDRVNTIFLGPLGDMVAMTGDGRLNVLHETVRKRMWDGVAAATQISANMVVIESVTGVQCLLKSTSKVRGLSIAFPNIAVWSGSQIDVYTINESTYALSLLNFVPTTSPAFALHRDGLLYVKDSRIVFTTLQLQPISQLTFTDAEGEPVLIDVKNDFMVALSSKNVLRLAKISARDLRPLGPSRPLQLIDTPTVDPTDSSADPTSHPAKHQNGKEPVRVVAARVNAQGRRVALMSTVGTLGVPDSRIWIYDSDTDKVTSFDFTSRNEVPDSVYWNTPEPNANAVGELEYLLLACETHQSHKAARLGAAPEPVDGEAHAAEDNVSGEEGDGTATGGKKAVHHEDLPEALPDMQNFKDGPGDDRTGTRRSSLGATSLIANREHNLVTLFATRKGVVVHNSVSLKEYQICLVGLTIPDFLLASIKINGNPSNPEDYVIEQKRLRDFDGLKSDKDAAVREALMKFSYYSTIGDMDEAYRCIKTIKNPAAWQGLARMCVSNGRLDVAAVCLATMQDSIGARALRQIREDYPDEKKVQLATLACALNMNEECEALLFEAKRYDLITDLYLACGKFEQAQRHSEKLDRMRIRPVAYKYAQFMESLQNMDAAIMWYFNAKCADTDVPRVFYQTNRLPELRALLSAAADNGQPPYFTEEPLATFATLFPQNRELLLWWAHHCERRRNISEALRFYHTGKDVYNSVRLFCGMNPPKIDAAVELVNAEVQSAKAKFDQHTMLSQSSDRTNGAPEPVGAAYFVGRLYEKTGDLEKALKFYTIAAAYRSGIEVAKKLDRDEPILSLALASDDTRLMLENAMFFDKKGSYAKSVQLYRKVGATQLALDTCIKGGQYDTLHEISSELADSSTDPEVFLRMSDHFQSIAQYQKAVEMLVFAKRYEEALQMAQERNVVLTDDMAEAMTGPNNTMLPDAKNQLLHRIAHLAKDQGSWSLACKKYTQAGERVKALKMLMRGGETEKVIFFANHSRSVEIYNLAANFLQSQNWSADPNVYKSIVHFYTKAKAYESLASFFDSGAQLQIDDNRNYVEALRMMEECMRALEKAQATSGGSSTDGITMSRAEQLKERTAIIRRFVKAQQTVQSMNASAKGSPEEKTKADEVVAICSDFVKRSRPGSPDKDVIDAAIRIGDVFALLVKFYFEKTGEPSNAFKVLESMPKHGAAPQLFLEMDYMEKVCTACGKRIADVVDTSANAALKDAERRRSSALMEEALKPT